MTGALPDLTTGLAFLGAFAALVTTGSWRAALRILLDLLVAAGLLRLSLAGGWSALAVAAVVVALRQLLWATLAAGPPGPAPTSPPGCGGDDHRLVRCPLTRTGFPVDVVDPRLGGERLPTGWWGGPPRAN